MSNDTAYKIILSQHAGEQPMTFQQKSFIRAIESYLNILERNPWIMGHATDDVPLEIVSDKQEMIEFSLKHHTILGVVYQDKYLTLIRDLVSNTEGRRFPYVRLFNTAALQNGAFGVVVLPIWNEKIVLIKTFRHAIRNWSLEIPRGFGEPNINSEELVAMELAEEIGASAKRIVPVGALHNNAGMEANRVQVFVAELDTLDISDIDGEAGRIIIVPKQDFASMIRNNAITDGFTLSAYALAKTKGYFS